MIIGYCAVVNKNDCIGPLCHDPCKYIVLARGKLMKTNVYIIFIYK